MSDRPPPLPDGDDPWLVLGVARGADERELKRAYARRIKVYRPDRSPDEFMRVQAAYERAQQLAAMGLRFRADAPDDVEEAPPEPAPAPAVEVTPAEPAAPRVGLTDVADALARGDTAAAEAHWAASGLALDAVFWRAPPEVRRWLLGRAPVTWKALSRWDDRGASAVAWLDALRLRLTDGRSADVKAMVEEPTFLADLEHDELAAELGLRAVSALAWHGPAARRLFEKLGKIPHLRALELRHDRARLDLEIGEYARDERPRRRGGRRPRIAVPAALRRYLTESSLVGGDEARELAAALYQDLDRRLDDYIAWTRDLYEHDAHLGQAMTHRLLDDVPPERREHEELSPRARRRLADGLRDLRRPLPVLGLSLVLGVLLILAVIVFRGTHRDDLEPAIWGAGGLVVIALLIERYLYGRAGRVRLIRLLVDAGVTRVALRQQITLSASSLFRYGPSAMFLPNDHPMRLLSFIAAATFPEGEEDDEEPEDEVSRRAEGSLIDEDDPDAPQGPIRRFFEWFNNRRW